MTPALAGKATGLRSTWPGDGAGGVTAALAALPVEMVYGLIAVAPLGATYAEHGLRGALWGCILGGVLAFVLRGTGGMMTGSRPATGLILAALAAVLLQQRAVLDAPDPAGLAFVLLLLCTALAGVFQLAFGLAQVGRVLKYVPYPVVAGLMLGVAVLLFLFALRPALGIPAATPWEEAYGAWRPFSILVTSLTLLVCFRGRSLTKKVPSAVLALIAGTVLHHALALLVGPQNVGATSGSVSGLLPFLSLWQGFAQYGAGSLLAWLSFLLPYALAIAAFASLETMLCLSAVDAACGRRTDGDRELRVQGAANLIGGVLGATPCAGNLTRVTINLAAGARTPLSSLVYAAVLVVVVLFVGTWMGLVPAAATAGILIFYAIGMVDDGTHRLAGQVILQRHLLEPSEYRILLANLMVLVLVALVAVLGDMMKAVATGVAAAMFLFVRSNMKPVIRRVFTIEHHRSLKVRSAEDMRLLAREGRAVSVIEVEGPLFFGTADRLAREIEKRAQHSASLILDLRRMSDVDPTGGRTLLSASTRVTNRGCRLSLAGGGARVERFLKAMGLDACVAPEHWHHDLDTALEWEEDSLLATLGAEGEQAVVHLAQTALVQGLSASETLLLERYLDKHLYDRPGKVFAIGESGESLFVATGSAVDIVLPLQNGKHKRVASFAPGVVFGEMALLEGKPRSADAIVKGPSTVWELSRDKLAEIEFMHPEIARRVFLNVSRSLAGRLRATTAELRLEAEG